MTWLRQNVFELLDVLKFIGIILLVFMFIHFNTIAANQAQETKTIATNTNRVVKSQDDILQAIKRATEDSKLTQEQKLDITICMLKVPVSQRTTDVEHNCRNQATLEPATPSSASAVAPQPPSRLSVSSSQPNSAPSSDKTQATPSQPSPQPNLIQRVVTNIKGIL